MGAGQLMHLMQLMHLARSLARGSQESELEYYWNDLLRAVSQRFSSCMPTPYNSLPARYTLYTHGHRTGSAYRGHPLCYPRG